MTIIELSERPDLLENGIRYFWNCWGNPTNFKFYENCIRNSLDRKNKLPKFYLAVQENSIIGSYALLVNDLVSRQDLTPWLGCLFVEEAHRNKGIGGKLLVHGLEQAKLKGFEMLYLSTDLDRFYEKKGWQVFSRAFGVGGDAFKVYACATNR